MTRKHFEAIAADLNAQFVRNNVLFDANVYDIDAKVERDLATQGIVRRLTNTFSAMNPRFDAERFEKACHKGVF